MGRRREEVVMVVSADVSVPLFEFWWMGMWMWDWGLLELQLQTLRASLI